MPIYEMYWKILSITTNPFSQVYILLPRNFTLVRGVSSASLTACLFVQPIFTSYPYEKYFTLQHMQMQQLP